MVSVAEYALFVLDLFDVNNVVVTGFKYSTEILAFYFICFASNQDADSTKRL